jgi:hypothetical protein
MSLGMSWNIFLTARQLPSPSVSSLLRFRDHTWYESSGRVISPSQKPVPDNTQRLPVANIHAPGSIRPPIPSTQAATYSRRRWRGNLDRHLSIYIPVMATWVRRANMNPLKTALANKEIKWKVSSKTPAILLFPVSMIYCQHSRPLFHNKHRQCTYNVTLRGVRVIFCCSGKAISITQPDGVFF